MSHLTIRNKHTSYIIRDELAVFFITTFCGTLRTTLDGLITKNMNINKKKKTALDVAGNQTKLQ